MRRRRIVLLVLVVVAAPMLVASVVGAQVEPPVTGVGWWTDRVLAQEKAEDGIEVARTLDGVSVAAIRVESGGAVASATITLTEVETGVVRAEDAVVDVCDTGPFVAADAGDIAEAPATECADGLALTRGDDGTWTGDVTVLLGDSTTFLAIVPGPVPDDAPPLDPGFLLEFEAPAVSVTLASTEEVTPPSPVDTVAPPPDFSAPAPSPSVDFGGSSSPSFESPAIETAPVTTVAPPVDASTSESTEIAGPTINSGPISGGSGDAKPWVRLLLLVPMSAAAGAVAVVGRRRLVPTTA